MLHRALSRHVFKFSMTTPARLRELVAQCAPNQPFTTDELALTEVYYFFNVNWVKLKLPDESDTTFRAVVDLFKQGECRRSNCTHVERPNNLPNGGKHLPIDCGFGRERKVKNWTKAAHGPATLPPFSNDGKQNQSTEATDIQSSKIATDF